MRVLFVTNQYPTEKKPNTNPAVLYQEKGLRNMGLQVDVFFVDRVGFGPLAYLRSYFPLRRRWAHGSYDLMHIQFGGLQALVGALIAGRHTVITYHGSDLHGGNPANRFSRMFSKLNVWSSQQAAKLSGGIAVVSPNLISFLSEHLQPEVCVFPPGVDYDVFYSSSRKDARETLNLDPNRYYILFSDISGSPVKRRDIALAVERAVQRMETKAGLLLLQDQPYWRVPLFLNAADCLLVTSEKEGSPNIVKEALAVNLPIVSVDVGDVALRCNGVLNCQIIERDVNLLAEAVLRAFGMDRSMGGREVKQSEISNQSVCERVFTFYKEVLLRVY